MLDKAISRRQFLKHSLSASLGFGLLGNLQNLAAASYPTDSYKALVCVFLYGGNDSYNMLIPHRSEDATTLGRGYESYRLSRGALAVENNDLNFEIQSYLNGGLLPQSVAREYLKGFYPVNSEVAVSSVMPEMAKRLMDGEASYILNAGTLIQPTSKEDIVAIRSKAVTDKRLPQFLFAHNHQQRAMQTGIANNLKAAGWGGRLADQWQGVNGQSAMAMNISFSGTEHLLIGNNSMPLALHPRNTLKYRDINNWSSASHLQRKQLFEQVAHTQKPSAFHELYTSMRMNAFNMIHTLNEHWEGAPTFDATQDSYGLPLFSVPSQGVCGFDLAGGRLIEQLEGVAKMIALASSSDKFNLKRQVFAVQLGGFDTHADQINKHPALLRQLSLAMDKFYRAIDSFGLASQVNTFTLSEFGRTLTMNNNGTDHAWAGHHFNLGPALNQTGYGQLADLTMGGDQDYGNKGLIIPDIAMEQYLASLASWFGVDETLMSELFPNLSNFKTDASLTSAYLS